MTTATRESDLADLVPPPEHIRAELARCATRASLLRRLLRLRLDADQERAPDGAAQNLPTRS